MTVFEKEAFELIKKAKSAEYLYIGVNENLSENTKAIMSAYGIFGNKSISTDGSESFYKLTSDGLILLEKRDDRVSTKRRANIALCVSIIAVLVSIVAVILQIIKRC